MICTFKMYLGIASWPQSVNLAHEYFFECKDQKKLNGAKSGPARTTTTGYKKPPWRGHPFILEQGTQGVQWPGRET